MTGSLQAIKGMHDVLPEASHGWQHLEDTLRGLLDRYGYREIRFPLLEKTELFERSIGATTDIVSKEMYTFDDRNGDSLTLRPEGTAGCVRAGIQHGIFQSPGQRLWYMGPMFRHERPQKGRYRQFHQLGAEAFGMAGPDIDAELVCLTARMWKELGLRDLRLQLNTLGSEDCRGRYRQALLDYFRVHIDSLDPESRDRLERNPMRILDSKNEAMLQVISAAPVMTDFLSAGAARHFEDLQSLLRSAGLEFEINPRLVRGLDYYNGTVFEWVSDCLGAQSAVCAGGRYDSLVELFGGAPTPAIGFAMGLERLLDLQAELDAAPAPRPPHVYLAATGGDAAAPVISLAERLRDELPALRLLVHCGGGSLKSQLKRADRSGAVLALILGEDEIRAGKASLKSLRDDSGQELIPLAKLADELCRRLQL